MTQPKLDIDTGELARLYEVVSEHQYRAGMLLLDSLKLGPGERALDVGAGTGRLAVYAAQLVGESGEVVGVDPLPDRIQIASQKSKANLSFAVGDAMDLSRFPPASFDVVYLNAVFHWLPDKQKALREFARVLRPGGRLGIMTGSGDHIYLHQKIKASILSKSQYKKYNSGGSGDAAKLVTKVELEGLLAGAGFEQTELVYTPNVVVTQDGEAMVDFVEASSFGNFLGHLPEDVRATIRGEVVQEYEALRTEEGIRAETKRLLAISASPVRGDPGGYPERRTLYRTMTVSPFTWESTAEEVASTLRQQIKGKNVIVTGASPGSIAFGAAKAIAAREPGLLVLTARTLSALEKAKAAILSQSPNVDIRLVDFDLGSQNSVRDAAQRVKAFGKKIDVLINAAGVMGTPHGLTPEGIETQFGINHIGHFLFTNLLVPILNDGASIVNVSSDGYKLGPMQWENLNPEGTPYNKFFSYAQSKAASILFSAALARKLASRGIISFSINPGAIPTTKITRHLTKEDFELLANAPVKLKQTERGPTTMLIAAFDPSIRESNGGYIDEDNQVKPIPEEHGHVRGVENEDRLWALSEKLVRQKFSV
ncbi:hypothetical protein BDV59DRAFT_198693 [Aspergillus ambiguus]|uniref:uncharacterized protein n=1 Tax=Aspergillus ambiguus TaxID=176160 RepID=UPI003CCDEE91